MPFDSPSDSPARSQLQSLGTRASPAMLPPNGNPSDLLRPANDSLQSAQAHEPYANDPSAGSPKPSFAREFHSPAEHAHAQTCFLAPGPAVRRKYCARTPSNAGARRIYPDLENKTRNEPFKTAATVPMTRTARATLSSSACSPLRPAKQSPRPLPNPAGASPRTPLPACQPIPPQANPHPPRAPRTRAEMLFPGITIQGGEWKSDSHPAEPTPASPRREESHRSSYALTIASSGNSGGGLKDFGVFGSESVFTDYFDVTAPGARLRRLGSCSTRWQRLAAVRKTRLFPRSP